MNNKKFANRYIIILMCFFFCQVNNPAFAKKKAKKVVTVPVSGIVLNNYNLPLTDVLVKSNNSGNTIFTDAEGKFEIQATVNDYLTVSHPGLGEMLLPVRDGQLGQSEIILKRKRSIDPENLVDVSFDGLRSETFPGDIIRISGDELSRHPGQNFHEALTGKIPGLRIEQTSSNPGASDFSIKHRGNSPLILLDGLPRPVRLQTSEIEEVVFLKDLAATAMYGDIGSRGILLIKTKRGKAGVNRIEVDYTHGVNFATRMPEFVGAYEQAMLINKAAQNSDLSDIYTPEELYGYMTNSDPIKYPNIDYQDMFLNDFATNQTAGINFIGGNDQYRYSTHIGYNGSTGLEKVGEQIKSKELIFRSNLDIDLSESSKFNFGIWGGYKKRRTPVLNVGDFFSVVSNYPAYAMPLIIGDSAFVYSTEYGKNLLAKQVKGGHQNLTYRNGGINSMLDVDLKNITKGLTFNTQFALDLYNAVGYEQKNTPEDFQVVYLNDSLTLEKRNSEKIATKESKESDNVMRSYIFSSNLNYQRAFNNHALNANLRYFQFFKERKGNVQDDRNQMVNLGLNYAFKNKYILSGTCSYAGYQKLPAGNKFDLFPVIGGAWVVSRENFMKGSKVVNYLKLRGSYGKMGSMTTDNYYADSYWGSSGSLNFGIKGSTTGSGSCYVLKRTGNPYLSWPTMTNLTLGVEGNFFNDHLSAQIDLYKENLEGSTEQLTSVYSQMVGNNNYLPRENFGETERKGLELMLNYSDQKGDFYYSIGAVGSMEEEIYKTVNQVNYPESYRLKINRATDIIWGYESAGLFQNQEDIDSSPLHLLGVVQPGDIKYVDQNNDDVIDERDQVELGHKDPRIICGLNLLLGYKKWSLYVQGYGEADVDYNAVENRYYNHYGKNKFSKNALDILDNPDDYPVLRLQKSSNNSKNSSYWIKNAAYFRLENVELAYTTPVKFGSKVLSQSAKFFIKGRNLAVISPIKDLDPEDMGAGLSSYPMLAEVAFGVSFKL